MAVVTDMCPLRDPTRRAREVAKELTKSGDGTPLFQAITDAAIPGYPFHRYFGLLLLHGVVVILESVRSKVSSSTWAVSRRDL